MRRAVLAIAATLAIAVVPAISLAVPGSRAASGSDVRELDPHAHHSIIVTPQARSELRQARTTDTRTPPAVGDQRIWLGYDALAGDYPKL